MMILIVGEIINPAAPVGSIPWVTPSYSLRRLLGWLGLSTVPDNMRGVNVGDVSREELEQDVRRARTVIILGRVAERALLGSTGPVPRLQGKLFVLPHPSGRNRMLNDPRLNSACKRLMELVEKG